MGIRSIMITGDNPLTAAAIASEAGVDDFLAQATPEDKLKLLRSEQAAGHLVAMTGDGTNDGPALAAQVYFQLEQLIRFGDFFGLQDRAHPQLQLCKIFIDDPGLDRVVRRCCFTRYFSRLAWSFFCPWPLSVFPCLLIPAACSLRAAKYARL